MLNVRRPSWVRSLLYCLLVATAGSAAKAQTSQNPALDRQLHRLDVAVTASVVLGINSNGTAVINTVPTSINLDPSNTVGPLVTVRYTVKPLIGFEFNYGYARFTQNFTPFGGTGETGGVQQNTSEYTFGYVAHFSPRHGITPFAGAGLGTLDFRPTPGGGEGLLPQARATYYYTVGGDYMLSEHFGARAQFREQFYLAPDFETNYLTIHAHTTTFEPGFGFFARF
jgi:Outer membrane protein beta-barrel domain